MKELNANYATHLASAVFALLLLFFMACNGENETNDFPLSIIEGRFAGEEWPNELSYETGYGVQNSTSVDDSGRFRIELRQWDPIQLSIWYTTSCVLMLEAGDSVYVEFDEDGEVQFTGDRKEDHLILTQTIQLGRDLFRKIAPELQKQSMEERLTTFLTFRDELTEKIRALKDEVEVKLHPKTEAILSTSPFYLSSHYARSMILYQPDLDSVLKAKVEDELHLPEWNEDLYYTGNFNSQLSQSIMEGAGKRLREIKSEREESLEYEEEMEVYGQVIREEVPDSTLWEFSMFQQLYVRLKYSGFSGFEIDDFQNVIEKNISQDLYAETLQELIEDWRPLMAGRPAPDVELVDSAGNSLRLSDFLGQFVYIDIWATWCGPCIQQQPAWEELYEKFDGKPIVFLAVSIDHSTVPWKNMLKKKEISGIQAYSEGEWHSPIAKEYRVFSIPRYLLIDRDGKIVKTFAPRPGDAEELLNELIEKDQNSMASL